MNDDKVLDHQDIELMKKKEMDTNMYRAAKRVSKQRSKSGYAAPFLPTLTCCLVLLCLY